PSTAPRHGACAEADTEFPVVIGAGSHPFPFRTRKLSLLPPMVLRGKLRGRVGRCRHYFERKARCGNRSGLSFVPFTLLGSPFVVPGSWYPVRVLADVQEQ